MAINSVTADRRAQNNNLYAGIGAAVAGAGGALGGSYMAPRAAKTLDDLVFGDADVFDKSVNKMRNRNINAFNEAMQTIIPARAFKNSLNNIVDTSFAEEKVPLEKVNEFIKTKEGLINEAFNGYNAVVDEYSSKSKVFTLNELYDDLLKHKALTKESCKEIKELMAASYGEEVLDAPTVMDAEKIKALTADRDRLVQAGNLELNLYKKFTALEKDGVVLKKDMLDTVKSEAKSMTDPFLTKTSFDRFKKFVPRKGAALYAMAAGLASALIAGGAIKLFGIKSDKA